MKLLYIALGLAVITAVCVVIARHNLKDMDWEKYEGEMWE
jgi:hypothetical protein